MTVSVSVSVSVSLGKSLSWYCESGDSQDLNGIKQIVILPQHAILNKVNLQGVIISTVGARALVLLGVSLTSTTRF